MFRLYFQVQEDHLPTGFLRDDIRMSEKSRHLVLATDQQLQLLSQAKTWYMDATFKVRVKKIVVKCIIKLLLFNIIIDVIII